MRDALFVVLSSLILVIALCDWLRRILQRWNARFSMRDIVRQLRGARLRFVEALGRIRDSASAFFARQSRRKIRLFRFRFLSRTWQLWLCLSPTTSGMEGPPGPPPLPGA